MSWADVFPIMTDELLELFHAGATGEELAYLDELLAVEKTFNIQQGTHLVTTSLFWKNSAQSEGELPVVTRETMKGAGELGLISRFAPWDHYVQPLLDGAAALKISRPEVVFRVYLAADLEFLVEDLVAAGCEVFLMRSSSLRHNPGALWRFLALGEEGRWITVTDSDRAPEVVHDVERTDHVMAAGLGLWRLSYVFARGELRGRPEYYRPVAAGQFGARGGLPVADLMRAFIWHTLRGSMPDRCHVVPGDSGQPMAGSSWPDYGFDEWFLLAAVYPRMAFDGILTFFKGDRVDFTTWHLLDIEYATWANPMSEVFRCPMPGNSDWQPWSEWKAPRGVATRLDTEVVYRSRPLRCGRNRPVEEREEVVARRFAGDLRGILSWAGSNVSLGWWADVDPRISMKGEGAEIFMDRRFHEADLVVCGSYFVRVTDSLAKWAMERGLDEWRPGGILKVPKLDGPLTLWRTDFGRAFHSGLASTASSIDAETVMALWIAKRECRVMETTAGAMGWKLR